jgi:peroxin-16
MRGLTGLEREELKKRGWGMAWWTMRGAFYENITRYAARVSILLATGHANTRDRPWIQSATNKMRDKPLINLVGSVIEDYEYLWENYYFSTATL